MTTHCRCLWFLKRGLWETQGTSDQNNIDTLSAAGIALIAIKLHRDFISSLHETNLCKSNLTR